jgi:hypothetical protein
VLNGCTDDYFGVTLNPNGFTPSASGGVGSFTGTGPSYLPTNPHGAGNNDTFMVKNNSSTYDTKYLTFLDNQFRAAMGRPPNPPGVTVVGTTNRFAPLTNYTSRNLGPMQTLVTQVHELGHSLDAITGIGYDFKKDDLAGRILENCVRSRGGFKYK